MISIHPTITIDIVGHYPPIMVDKSRIAVWPACPTWWTIWHTHMPLLVCHWFNCRLLNVMWWFLKIRVRRNHPRLVIYSDKPCISWPKNICKAKQHGRLQRPKGDSNRPVVMERMKQHSSIDWTSIIGISNSISNALVIWVINQIAHQRKVIGPIDLTN